MTTNKIIDDYIRDEAEQVAWEQSPAGTVYRDIYTLENTIDQLMEVAKSTPELLAEHNERLIALLPSVIALGLAALSAHINGMINEHKT